MTKTEVSDLRDTKTERKGKKRRGKKAKGKRWDGKT